MLAVTSFKIFPKETIWIIHVSQYLTEGMQTKVAKTIVLDSATDSLKVFNKTDTKMYAIYITNINLLRESSCN